jgi:hypothetical protein
VASQGRILPHEFMELTMGQIEVMMTPSEKVGKTRTMGLNFRRIAANMQEIEQKKQDHLDGLLQQLRERK